MSTSQKTILLFGLLVSSFSLRSPASPQLAISLSATNAQLHWFADSTFALETTTNQLSANSWSLVDYLIPVQIGSAEYILTHPVDVSARFFRLHQMNLPDTDPVLSVATSALTLTESNTNACFNVANVGGTNSTLTYSVSSDASWLTVSPGGSMAAGETNSVCVSADGTELFAGATYYATVTISDSAGHTLRNILVSFIIPPATLIVQTMNAASSVLGQEGSDVYVYPTNWSEGYSSSTTSNFYSGLTADIYYHSATPYPSSGDWSGSASARQSLATSLSASCSCDASASVGALRADDPSINESGQGAGSFAFSFSVTHKTHFRVNGSGQETSARQDAGGATVSWAVQGGNLVSATDQTPGSGTFVQNYNVNNGVFEAGAHVYVFQGSAEAGGFVSRGINSNTGEEIFTASLPGQASLSLTLQLY